MSVSLKAAYMSFSLSGDHHRAEAVLKISSKKRRKEKGARKGQKVKGRGSKVKGDHIIIVTFIEPIGPAVYGSCLGATCRNGSGHGILFCCVQQVHIILHHIRLEGGEGGEGGGREREEIVWNWIVILCPKRTTHSPSGLHVMY